MHENADAAVAALRRRDVPPAQQIPTIRGNLDLFVRQVQIAGVPYESAKRHRERALGLAFRHGRQPHGLAGLEVPDEVAHQLPRRRERLTFDRGDDVVALEADLSRHFPRAHDTEAARLLRRPRESEKRVARNRAVIRDPLIPKTFARDATLPRDVIDRHPIDEKRSEDNAGPQGEDQERDNDLFHGGCMISQHAPRTGGGPRQSPDLSAGALSFLHHRSIY